MVKYTYDAWGNHTITDYTEFGLGSINPFRYRSYYYDTETGLYYLKSRYYDPQTGRFISMDDISYLDPETIGGANLYAYCSNNPVMRIDPCGSEWWKFWEWNWGTILDIGVTTVATINAVIAGALASAFVSARVFINNLLRTRNVLASKTVSSAAGLVAGVATAMTVFGAYNNTVNAIYYAFVDVETSPLNEEKKINDIKISSYVSDSFGFKYINRWDRLKHTKGSTKEIWYTFDAWLYYSEYSAHMYGWLANVKFGLFSNYQSNLIYADVFKGVIDTGMVFLPTVLLGFLGM